MHFAFRRSGENKAYFCMPVSETLTLNERFRTPAATNLYGLSGQAKQINQK
jgi:hypothetical protein